MRRPVVLIPGFGGSILVPSGCVSKKLLNTRVPDNRWLNIPSVITGGGIRQWQRDMQLQLVENSHGRIVGTRAASDLTPYDFGGTRGVKDIVPEFTLLPPHHQHGLNDMFCHRYMHSLVDSLHQHGHVDRVSVFGAPYDFRMILDPIVRNLYFANLQSLVEQAARLNGEQVVIVSHSLGGLMFKWFASSFVSADWCARHIGQWVCLSVPFGGSYQALRAATAGQHYLPLLRSSVQQALQHNHGLIACFPNTLAFCEDEPLWELAGKPVSMRDLPGLAGDGIVPFRIWRDLGWPAGMGAEIAARLTVPTHVIYTAPESTHGIAHSASWDASPHHVGSVPGDGIVPVRSLRACDQVIARNGLRETVLPSGNHTSVLHDATVIRAILDHCVTRKMHPA